MSDLRRFFFSLFDRLADSLQAGECLLCNFLGEQSDFVRLNGNKVRQAGQVRQFELALNLISDHRSAKAMTHVTGLIEADAEHGFRIIASLRDQIDSIPQDPYLWINRNVENSESIGLNQLEPATRTIEEILASSGQLDLVGLYASGPICRGFANSFGQRNWYVRSSFNFEWSCFLENNQAVKSRYAGFVWDLAEFERKTKRIKQSIELITRPEKSISPGRYRVFLAPAAVQELLSTVAWQGFGAKGHRTGQSSLFKLARGIERLNSAVCLIENNQSGLAPDFTRTGFIKPSRVDLILQGTHAGMLVNSRSAKEYGLTVNADSEYPASLEMAAGALDDNDVLKSLNTGLYISNLWYCNYSDQNECRITGMTRYACFWVENGKIRAPINPMRFDESLYRVLGSNLLAIAREQEWILSSDTYLRRSVSSMRIPGLLIDDFSFTL
ncbi:MAG: metallopeptidase TldD-related protein [Methylococcales bacterium]